MKILVTGGAGYIGSTVVAQLAERYEKIVVVDDLSQGHAGAVHPAADLVQGDLADAEFVDALIGEQKPDGVMHFASRTLVGESMERPFLYLGENTVNGLNLIEAAARHRVQRFILSSTANLFGLPDEVPITESAPIRPGSPYGESKHFLERVLHWMDEVHGMRYACLRYFNAAGAASPVHGEDHDPETHLIPLVLQVALGQRDRILVFGDDYDTPDGTCIRDYIHVLDLARAHVRCLESIGDRSRTYNLGIGRGYSVKEVIETARAVTGHAIPAEVVARRPGDPAVLIAGNQKIRDELGWAPRFTDLRSIVASAWEWHRRNPGGYRDLSP